MAYINKQTKIPSLTGKETHQEGSCTVVHVFREANKVADLLASRTTNNSLRELASNRLEKESQKVVHDDENGRMLPL